MTKFGKKLTAALCACMLAAAALPASSASALDPVPQTPDWVPTDVESTVSFLNTYGKTHTEGGFICIVIVQGPKTEYWFTADPALYVVSDQNVEYKIPEDPGKLHTDMTEEEYEEYFKKLRAYEEYQRFIEDCGEEALASLQTYRVVTLMPTEVGEHAVSVATSPENELIEQEPIPFAGYTFDCAADGSITETDELGWRPDSITEFNAYRKEHGLMSIHDGKVVLAIDFNASTGAELVIDQNGARFELESADRIPYRYVYPMMLAGESTHVIQVYRPTEEGFTYFTVFNGQPWAREYALDNEIAAVESKKDGDAGFKSEFTSAVFCDLNADHRLDLADLVMLAKFLTKDAEFTDAQLMIADYTGDCKVNACDLTAIKQLLFTDIIWIDDPIIIDNPIIIDDPVVVVTE